MNEVGITAYEADGTVTVEDTATSPEAAESEPG